MVTRKQLDKMSACKVLILALLKFYFYICFDLIKEVINERLKLDDVGPAVRLVTLYNRFELINNRVTERLFNCIRNGIYVTCSMYDELKSLEDEKEVDRC